MTDTAPYSPIAQSPPDALPVPAVNLARRARQLKATGGERHNRVKLELIFLANGDWLLIVEDSRKVENLGKE